MCLICDLSEFAESLDLSCPMTRGIVAALDIVYAGAFDGVLGADVMKDIRMDRAMANGFDPTAEVSEEEAEALIEEFIAERGLSFAEIGEFALIEGANDLPDGAGTPVFLPAGGDQVEGTIGFAGDRDNVWVSVSDQSVITVDMQGVTLGDTVVTLYDDAGNIVATNDDFNGAFNRSFIEVFIETAGNYRIEFDGFGSSTGTYVADVSAAAVANDTWLSGIDWGGTGNRVQDNDPQTTTTDINWYLAPSGENVGILGSIVIPSEGFTTFEIQQITQIFDDIEDYIDVNFTRVSSQALADFTVGTANFSNYGASGLVGIFGPPNEGDEGNGFLSSDPQFANATTWQRGGFMYATAIHEFGHGLGLAHPHDEGGGSNVFPLVSAPTGPDGLGVYTGNQPIHTVMSYQDPFVLQDQSAVPISQRGDGHNSTFAPLDVAVLQAKYGANPTTNGGDDVYDFSSTTEWFTIWDTGGTDWIVSGDDNAVIRLSDASLDFEFGGGGLPSFTNLSTARGGFTIANGADIENGQGGQGNDWLEGNELANTLIGGGGGDLVQGLDGDDVLRGNLGFDTLEAGTGNDTIDAGKGDDTILGQQGDDVIYAGIGRDTVEGGGGSDYIEADIGADSVYAGSGDDTVYGGKGDDDIYGGPGADLIVDERGANTIEGGGGDDTYVIGNSRTVLVENNASGVDTVESPLAYVLGANFENLTLTGTRSFSGTGNALDNTIVGNDGDNILRGEDGNDDVSGGDGDDFVQGGDGNDTVVGNAGNDNLRGSAGGDELFGNFGDDTLGGDAGADLLDGGRGDNTLTGGLGTDTFQFTGATAGEVSDITDFVAGTDVIALRRNAFDVDFSGPGGTLDPSQFVVGSAATTSDHRIVYNTANDTLSLDLDGVGGQAQITFATINAAVSATDFVST